MDPDTGLQNLVKIRDEYAPIMGSLNETETRAKIIDAILKESLGWGEKDIRREDHVDRGFTDYQLLVDENPRLVIEAKKAGEYFEIPRTKTTRWLKIGGVLSKIPNLVNALDQVRAYSDNLGCKYAAVFNGYQLVIFSAITIGKNWRQGYCMVFYSLEDIIEHFTLLWNILAYEGVRGGSLIEYIDKGKRSLTFMKPIDVIHNPNHVWARNELYTYIQPISDFVFSELLDEKRTEVMKECYVYEKSTRQLGDELVSYFVDKLPHFLQQYKIRDFTETERKAGAFQKTYLMRTMDQTRGSLIVLVGGIGSGKSTFLHRFFKVVLGDRPNLLWFYIDFRLVSPSDSNVEAFITQHMMSQWEQQYASALYPTIEQHGFSVPGENAKEFFSKLFQLLRTLGYSITLIIDNVDQQETSFQENIFLLAGHLSDSFKTVTIVALREETFLASTRTGVFDAFLIPKFHIASPDFTSMIVARIKFTLKFLASEKGEYAPQVRESLQKYFSIVASSLTSRNKQSKKLVDFIDSVSVGNMRDALRMFNYFIVSGNTNVNEIFNVHSRTGAYQIAYHQFLKSIILGEHKYYSQDKSQLMNVFDFDTSLTDSHSGCLRVLRYLLNRNNKKSLIGRGYVAINELIASGEEVSIRRGVIYDLLLRLSHFNLVEFDNQSKTDVSGASYVKITHAGRYYLLNLIYEFVYLDSVLIDSPISDESLAELLAKLSIDPDLDRRLERTQLFVDYLKQAELDEFKDHPEYATSDLTDTRFGEDIAQAFHTVRSEVKAKAVS